MTMTHSKVRAWIEAMRLRTIPVSVAGVVVALGMALGSGCDVRWSAWLLCMVFAVLAQIASNFGNEYFDYKDGLDRPGREGPRRGVTEGDLSPQAMKNATFATLGLACACGCCLIYWGGWWLIVVGAVIALGALAYSAGPYPLSRHGLGEVAVVVFFGLVPILLTYWLITGMQPSVGQWSTALGMGLLGANVLVVNNYRDYDDDKAVGKRTLAVRLGRRAMVRLYAVNALSGVALTLPAWLTLDAWLAVIPVAVYAGLLVPLCRRMSRESGRSLNRLLGATARAMVLYALTLLVAGIAMG